MWKNINLLKNNGLYYPIIESNKEDLGYIIYEKIDVTEIAAN